MFVCLGLWFFRLGRQSCRRRCIKAGSQYNFLQSAMRLSTHATSSDSDTRFSLFFMFVATSGYPHAQVVLCTCTARAPMVEPVLHFVYAAFRMSHKLNLKADSQYNCLQSDMRLATHVTSCDSDTRFTIFFMFATSSCTSSTMHVHCTCTQGRNCTPFVYVACRMSRKLNFLQLLRHVPCNSLRQLVTTRDRHFLVATFANRLSRRRKLSCESHLTSTSATGAL